MTEHEERITHIHDWLPELLDKYLPWSEQLPDECRLSTKTKKQL